MTKKYTHMHTHTHILVCSQTLLNSEIYLYGLDISLDVKCTPKGPYIKGLVPRVVPRNQWNFLGGRAQQEVLTLLGEYLQKTDLRMRLLKHPTSLCFLPLHVIFHMQSATAIHYAHQTKPMELPNSPQVFPCCDHKLTNIVSFKTALKQQWLDAVIQISLGTHTSILQFLVCVPALLPVSGSSRYAP